MKNDDKFPLDNLISPEEFIKLYSNFRQILTSTEKANNLSTTPLDNVVTLFQSWFSIFIDINLASLHNQLHDKDDDDDDKDIWLIPGDES